MGAGHGRPTRAELITRWIARGLTLIVSGLWFFGDAGYWPSEYASLGWVSVRTHLYMLAAILAVLVLAYYFELAAGVLFITLARLLFKEMGRFPMQLTLETCLPLLLIGVLYITAWLLGRRRANAQRVINEGGVRVGRDSGPWSV